MQNIDVAVANSSQDSFLSRESGTPHCIPSDSPNDASPDGFQGQNAFGSASRAPQGDNRIRAAEMGVYSLISLHALFEVYCLEHMSKCSLSREPSYGFDSFHLLLMNGPLIDLLCIRAPLSRIAMKAR